MKDVNKRTKTINDDASIYQDRDEKFSKEQFKEMSLKEKLSYFLDYYAKTVLLVILIIGILVYFIYSVTSPKEKTILSVAVINDYKSEDTIVNLENEVGDYIGLGDMEDVNIDNTYYLDTSEMTQETDESGLDTPRVQETNDLASETPEEFADDTMFAASATASQMKLTTYIAAQEIDVIIAPEEVFETYSYQGFFDNLETTLPTDVFANLSDQLYFSSTEDLNISKPYGIRLDNWSPGESNQDQTHILGILANSPNRDNSVLFIRYLLSQ